ncbi:MAG TPA: hypothetical protein VGD74_06950 [Vulgatibacter sp.]
MRARGENRELSRAGREQTRERRFSRGSRVEGIAPAAAGTTPSGADRFRALRAAAESLAALAIAACLIACAMQPLLQDASCDQADGIDSRLASVVVRILGGDGASLEIRDRLRAEALEGSPAGRWETASEKAAIALASCDELRLAGRDPSSVEPHEAATSHPTGPVLAMAW